MKTREEKLTALMEYWLDQLVGLNSVDVYRQILRFGRKGFYNMTDEEVDKEYHEVFGDVLDED